MKRTVVRALAAIVMLPKVKKTIVVKKDGGSRFATKKEAVREAVEWAAALVDELYKEGCE